MLTKNDWTLIRAAGTEMVDTLPSSEDVPPADAARDRGDYVALQAKLEKAT
jgi:hypothetical protein